jgi:DNA-binding NarL/FixJ family response regulator
VAAAKRLQPDLIIMDGEIPLMDGIRAAQALRNTLTKCKIIFLSVHGDADYVDVALECGASGYVLKSQMNADLCQVIGQEYSWLRFRHPASPILSQKPMELSCGKNGGLWKIML